MVAVIFRLYRSLREGRDLFNKKMLKFKRKKYVDFFYLSKYMYTLKLKKSMLEFE